MPDWQQALLSSSSSWLLLLLFLLSLPNVKILTSWNVLCKCNLFVQWAINENVPCFNSVFIEECHLIRMKCRTPNLVIMKHIIMKMFLMILRNIASMTSYKVIPCKSPLPIDWLLCDDCRNWKWYGAYCRNRGSCVASDSVGKNYKVWISGVQRKVEVLFHAMAWRKRSGQVLESD